MGNLFNWGSESQADRELRQRLEMEALYEQAARINQARNRGNSTSFGGAGGGGVQGQGPAPVVFYLRASNSEGEVDNSEPWGSTSNVDELNSVFGEGGWTLRTFESINLELLNQIFSPETTYVFIDGSDQGADELAGFLATSLSTIESWVDQGGKLFLNAAPNVGGNINFGFGGVVLENDIDSDDVIIPEVAEGHPIFAGPGPTGPTWTGDSFSHAILSGEISPLLVNPALQVVCAELHWGTGTVIFGGMTVTLWHDPFPSAIYLRMNIHSYLSGKSYTPMLSMRRSLNTEEPKRSSRS